MHTVQREPSPGCDVPNLPAEATTAGTASVRQHGTRAMYVREKCRCVPCTAANAADARERDRARRRPDSIALDAFVSAEPVRLHLLRLADAGVGYKTVARISGVTPSHVAKIRSGDQKRLRRSTRERLLAVSVPVAGDVDEAAGGRARGAVVLEFGQPADGAWKDQAACHDAGIPIEAFFPEPGDDVSALLDFCARCGVRQACLEYALATDELGIWGGTTEAQRRQLRAAERAA